jgi:hypothetical protein
LKQNRELIDEDLNTQDTLVRLRSRPKILLTKTYEAAIHLFNRHKSNILGIITDVSFPYKGKLEKTAGFLLVEEIKRINSCIPIVLQSAESRNENLAKKSGVVFINKNSHTLLKDLRIFFLEYFGFGDFIFRDKAHHEIARASSLNQLERVLETIPEESLTIHAKHNHFSHWLFARGEFELAKLLQPFTLNDFQGIEDLRKHLTKTIRKSRREKQVGMISDFKQKSFDASLPFVKLSSGSMGGKARSLAFINSLLSTKMIEQKFENVEIRVPKTLIIASDEFDHFLEDNTLVSKALKTNSDAILKEMFHKAKLSTRLVSKLETFIKQVATPVAVRSSSLFEDSHDQPFAGLYETFMLPNNHPKLEKRLQSLCNAIKAVYASTFSKETKAYFKSTAFRLEEEKMSIIIQELVGDSYDNYFYPDMAGVAQSYNYYPISHMKPEDGIANVVLGFGKAVVDGGASLRFCPKYPKILPQFPDARSYLKYTQKRFYALNLKPNIFRKNSDIDEARFPKLGLQVAQEHGTLNAVGSVYSSDNDMIFDGTFREGAKLVTFSNILKNDLFPLAQILQYLPNVIADAFGGAIEMEFAATLPKVKGEKAKFYILQARPFLAMFERDEVEIVDKPKEEVLCKSNIALGNVKMSEILDIVYVNPDTFDHMDTRVMASEVAELNRTLSEEKKPYLLIGIGRWGTTDTSLGIPVTWSQISGADVIIEAALENFRVDPSNGTHFFHNLTSCKTAYITVNPSMHGDFVDWSWLNSLKKSKSLRYTHHVRLDSPITITVNGHKAEAQILKP